MYERNAIIIERYFNSMFGYDIKNNIKSNFYNYCELINALENYRNSIEEEEEVIIEYDIIANRIRDIQKKQNDLNKQNLQFQEERNNIFNNLDEDANLIQKKVDNVNKNIKKVDEEIQENALNFINVIAEFTERSIVRNKCGKNRRVIEIDYNKKLNDTLDNYKNIDINIEKRAKQFVELDTTEIKKELENKIKKNGEKEKIPFQEEVIEQAIILSIDVQKKETEILSNIYEKTNKLFAEIKNNSLKMFKHKKIIVDSTSKINFISAIKEYIVQFLDNERLAVVNGEKEYNKLMKDACKNLNNDLKQINNLYTLLLKEISKKASKKSYNDLYNIEYLKRLENKAEEFENQVKKLKLPVAVINPDYWRIEGMKRIYEVFNKCVTENYDRDLKEFVSSDEDSDEDSNDYLEEQDITKKVENNTEEQKNSMQEIFDEETDTQSDNNLKSEIDRKIDIILGIKDNDTSKVNKKSEQDEYDFETKNNSNINGIREDDEINKYDDGSKKEDNDDWEDEELEDEIEEDDDNWEDEELEDETEEDEDDWEDEELEDEIEEDEDDWEDEELEDKTVANDLEDKEKESKDYDIFGESDKVEDNESEYLDEDEDIDYDIWGNNITKKQRNSKTKKNKTERNIDNDWENEFINIDEKDKNKKKGFFEKFKK